MADRHIWLVTVLVLLVVNRRAGGQDAELPISNETVRWWAENIQIELKASSDFFTRRDQARKSFASATLENREDGKITKEIKEAIHAMMHMKIDAVKRIMDIAEQTAQAAKDEEVKSTYQYYNAKCLTADPNAEGEPCSNQTITLELQPDLHFWNVPVNTKHSAVHVPTNVFDRSREVLKAIKWSEELDATFKKNYNDDPSLSWQYFGSSTGFMRQYPAMEWKQNPVDLYDCRTRAWYIEAATSPKDVVILVDHSGSMTGVKQEIARHVVDDILDTLGNNDYVNILKFSEHTTEVVECFENRLVQANLANVRSFKQGLEDIKTENIANFSLALERAFDLLGSYRDENREDPYRGASCNQAIMLVTDGVPYNYRDIFDSYNWPEFPVRVFTYLVGREVADVRDIMWMACANRGYYVHLSTQAEVREQVLQYVPVMARPLVLTKTQHPVIWTPVYADLIDPKMTDWIWERKEFAVQKRVIMEARGLKVKGVKLDSQYVEQMKITTEVDSASRQEYKLMTSVSVPVFDKRDHANLTERVLLNEAVWVDQTRETRIANLLGVAGADVPISEITKLMDPFKLGVGGYAFIVTNNGYILYHPDLRAEFHGILKPNYNSVDFVEIEIIDDNREPREFNQELLKLRTKIVEQEVNGTSSEMKVMYHLDDLRRGGTMKRQYHYEPISGTPFTLVVSIPVEYGKYRVGSMIEVKHDESMKQSMDWFHGRLWRLHPDWVYCKLANESSVGENEKEFCYFLGRAQQPGWKWHNLTHPSSSSDKELFQSLLYDAKNTVWFTNDSAFNFNISTEERKTRFGVTWSFIATRSGLTRWQNHTNKHDYTAFGDVHPRAINEVWYRRAVDHCFKNRNTYVYSVPFDSGTLNDTLVTVSHAIFVEKDGNSAPAAVVGYQFQHKALRDLFFNKTSVCPDKNCVTCTSHDYDCFILDDNGYVIVSENNLNTGRFFGLVDNNVMAHLENMGIYTRVIFFDYQAVCFKLKGPPVITNAIAKPVHFILVLFKWLLSNLLWLGSHVGLSEAELHVPRDLVSDNQEEEEPPTNQTVVNEPVDDKHQINKTRPESCDQRVNFFTLQYDKVAKGVTQEGCTRPFFVRRLVDTNLILVVVNINCRREENYFVDIEPTEIDSYNNTLVCHKYASNNLPRNRPKDCISNHPKEKEIEMCGESSRHLLSHFLLFLMMMVLIKLHKLANIA